MKSRPSTERQNQVRSSKAVSASLGKKKSLTKIPLSKKSVFKDQVSVVDLIAGQIEASPLRRDFNLVRAILVETEQPGIHSFSFSGYDYQMVQAHLVLLIEAGFLHGSIMREGNGATRALVDRLTWTGHDLLALLRDRTRWEKAESAVLDPHGRAHFDVLVAQLKSK